MVGSLPTGSLVREVHEFQCYMQSGMFTFLVGPEKEQFPVHTKFVAEVSKVFDRMMNGYMKESVQRQAELPFVEPAVFTNFANFCYSGGYNLGRDGVSYDTNRPESSVIPLRHTHNIGNLGLALLRIDNQDYFHCANCAVEVKLVDGMTSFPYCSIDEAQDENSEKYCYICSNVKAESSVIGSVCQSCIQHSLDVEECVTYRTYGKTFWAKLEATSRMAIWLNAIDDKTPPKDALGDTEAIPQSILPDALLRHAKMYIFADTYEVPGLKTLSIAKLCSEMSWYEVTAVRVPQIVALIEYTYQNTCESSSCAKPNLLRRLVAKFVAFHAEVCMASDEAKGLFSRGGEMVIDIMRAMASKP